MNLTKFYYDIVKTNHFLNQNLLCQRSLIIVVTGKTHYIHLLSKMHYKPVNVTTVQNFINI